MPEAARSWFYLLDDDQVAQVHGVLDRALAADGTAPLSEQAVHHIAGKSELSRHLLWTLDDSIVGYASLEPPHGEHPAMVEVAVDPAHRGTKIGRGLVREALAKGGEGARVWAHGDLPAARAVAAHLGLRPVRELLQLRRPLDRPELPDVAVPDGVILRTYAGPEDDAELLRVNAAAFDWHPEQGSWTDREIAERRAESWFDPEGLFIAADAETGAFLGFHWTKVHPVTSESDELGEVYVVAVDPAAQGRGLGRLLTVAGLRYLRERGLGTVLLYTEADNVAALHTYERLGFERFHVDVAYA
ncbi:mycothiol synthase [Rhodococcus sp. UNC363MFTsu5.1]|uniref:mycothiol synthase n=1 Tax=Rhodococcus sp. UNC363MFTsu5.1 TaxID=1449069 RepID=UPI000481CAA8|nr:mycothiol synthase [Rhodococcus sp. UNC363MFTsu5.1]